MTMSLSRSLLRLRPYSSAVAEAVVSEESPATALKVIAAVPRDDSGKYAAARARKDHRVPSIVFSQEDGEHGGHKRLISVKANQMRNLVAAYGRASFLSRLFQLQVRSNSEPDSEIIEDVRVLPRLLHFHPTNQTPTNVTFIRAPPHALLKVDIPIVFRGEDVSPGLKKGSRLNTIRRTVKYLCPADLIPPFIEVDLSELDAGQKILIKDLDVHHELLPLLPKEGPVCNISGGKTYDHTKKTE